MKKTSLRRRSKKRQMEYDEYIPLEREFLEKHPWCQVDGCDRLAETVHHMGKRNGGRLRDQTKWMATCALCNGRMEDEPAWAIRQGYRFSIYRKND